MGYCLLNKDRGLDDYVDEIYGMGVLEDVDKVDEVIEVDPVGKLVNQVPNTSLFGFS